MAENKEEVVNKEETTKEVENTKNVETTKEVETTNQTEKTFTQKELDEIIETRLAKAKKGIPSKEEMKAFNDWKESQKTDAEKKAEKEKENLEIQNERDNLKKENLLLKKGVKDDDIDYVMFKVSKQDGEFKDNLEKFLKENPKFLSNYKEPTKTVDLGDEHKKEATEDYSRERKLLGI